PGRRRGDQVEPRRRRHPAVRQALQWIAGIDGAYNRDHKEDDRNKGSDPCRQELVEILAKDFLDDARTRTISLELHSLSRRFRVFDYDRSLDLAWEGIVAGNPLGKTVV